MTATGGTRVVGVAPGEGGTTSVAVAGPATLVEMDADALGLADAAFLAAREAGRAAAALGVGEDDVTVVVVGDAAPGPGGPDMALRLVHASEVLILAGIRVRGASREGATVRLALGPEASEDDLRRLEAAFGSFVADTRDAAVDGDEGALEAALARHGSEELDDPTPGLDGPRH